MHISEFDYELPEGLIAQEPAEKRDLSRLMVLEKKTGKISHASFSDFPGYLVPGDVLVINDTKVYPARLMGIKPSTGGSVEALLTRKREAGLYEAITRGRLPEGARVIFGGELEATVESDMGGGKKLVRFRDIAGLDEAVDRLGQVPLPPYISRKAGGEDGGRADDRNRYQTVYAKKRGAVAAPTAGLHFTPELLDAVRAIGVQIAPVTLHVGPGTFLPVRVDEIKRHVMEEEDYEISRESADAINAALTEGRRVVCVGTTSTRALESAAGEDGRVKAGESHSGLFIYPGYRFKVAGALLTNFHLPRSTLLMLVCAYAGRGNVMAAYAEAVKEKYRFYSYGDAMFIV